MSIRMASVRMTLVAVFMTMAAVLVPIPTALAGQDVVVDDFPLANQPRVMDGTILAIDSDGDNVIVGGTFSTIRNGAFGSPEITQKYLFKFNANTGLIDQSFDPLLDGTVEGIAISADGQSIYVGGLFVTINGETRQRIAKLSMADGSVDSTFVANASSDVYDIALTDDSLIVGGKLRRINGVTRDRLAAVNLTTGAPVSSFTIGIADSRYEWGPYIQEMDVTPDGNWLVIGGNFQTVGGVHREQVAVIDLSGANATVANWATTRYENDCASVYDATWIRGIDTSPDSSWFAVDTTGAHFGADVLCDTTTRWELPPTLSGTDLQPTWINHTGGDTVWAVHITDAAVYVGGHQRWENNPYPSPGGDNDGPGSVERPGIAALDPLTGVPLTWNPGRDRGRGIEAFHSTDDYLYIGSDTVYFADQIRQRLAVLPVAGGTPNPTPDDIELPTQLHVALPGGDLARADYDGISFGSTSTVSGPGVDGINWNDTRDGFVQRGQLVYFGAADAYYQRSYDGSTFGTPTNLSTSVGYVDEDRSLTPYDQPYGVDDTDSAAFAHGRVFYTATDDTSKLFWRWYSIESGILGAQEFVAAGGDWSGAAALDVMGDWLYAAWDDGNLYRMYIRDGGVVDYSTRQLADDGTSGIDWSSVSAMFSTQDSGSATPIPPPTPLVCNDPSLPWRAEYFAVPSLGTFPVTVQCEAEINYDWGSGSPAGTGVGPNDFSVRWTRDIDVVEEKAIEFTVTSDDGMRTFVDGVPVIEEWQTESLTDFVEESDLLTVGSHEVVVEYFEDSGDAIAQVALALVDPTPTVVATADNELEMYVNGSLVGSSTDWTEITTYFRDLELGDVIAVHATDTGGTGAFLAEMIYERKTKISNNAWRVSNTFQPNWQTVGFDDSGWDHATSYAVYGDAPWLEGVVGFPTGSSAEWIWSDDAVNDNSVYFRWIAGVSQPPIPDEWVAYNDMNTLGGEANPENVTEYEYDESGPLTDFATGVILPAMVTASTTTPDGPDQFDDGGPVDIGTDAFAAFDGFVDLTGGDQLDAGEESTLTFSGLDPAVEYAVTLSANRDNPDYAENRWARVAIGGAEAAISASSAGVHENPDDSVSFSIGDNSANGYVARWVGINPGADGEFTITTTWDQLLGTVPAGTSPNTKSYAMSAFRLETYSGIDTTDPVVIVTNPADGAVFERGESVTVEYSCADLESGIVSCEGTAPDRSPLDTTALGTGIEFTVTAVNGAGATTVVTHTYDVVEQLPGGTVEVRVETSSDDAEENVSGNNIGSVDLTSTDLELARDDQTGRGNQIVGMRFQNVDVSAEATIVSAYIEFETDETTSETTTLTISGEDADNAEAFTGSAYNISSRPQTSAQEAWSPGPWSTVNEKHQSPDISAVIQEIVDRGGWSRGNDMALFIEGTGKRTAESFDGESAAAPLLVIEYLNSTDPTITISGTPLDTFASDPGVPSQAQSYYVRGLNLTGDVVVTAPADFEVSTSSGGGFGSSVTLTQIRRFGCPYAGLRADAPCGQRHIERGTSPTRAPERRRATYHRCRNRRGDPVGEPR